MQVKEIFNDMSYGPAPESRETVDEWLQQHRDGFSFYINGEWVKPAEAKLFDSLNPATGEVLGRVSQGGAQAINAAVSAARAALVPWADLGGHGRARCLYALARLIQKHSRKLAVLESLDNGKPIRETRDIDVPTAARHFYYHAGWAQLLESELPGQEALGVIGQIRDRLEANDVASLGGVVTIPSILVAKRPRTPIAEHVFDIVGDEDFGEIARAQAWSRGVLGVRKKDCTKVVRSFKARTVKHRGQVVVSAIMLAKIGRPG